MLCLFPRPQLPGEELSSVTIRLEFVELHSDEMCEQYLTRGLTASRILLPEVVLALFDQVKVSVLISVEITNSVSIVVL